MRTMICAVALAGAALTMAACGDGQDDPGAGPGGAGDNLGAAGPMLGEGTRAQTGGGAAQGTTPTDGGGETMATGDGTAQTGR